MLGSTIEASFLVFFLAIAAIAFCLAIAHYRKRQELHRTGERAEGTVVRLEADERDWETPVSHPVVRFRTARGEWIEARYDNNMDVPTYTAGQVVTVLYDPNDPTYFVLGAAAVSAWEWGILALTIGVLAYGIYAYY
ncbi:DUF3592 domain-containing protein [Hymenobacter arizonensis]|uniref:DUF3592 domain-containing protein n=1 Tax=Hymenobacter arizonensis TaxID=1227077 RepID=A0A1I6BCY4_HYMAR|nr:DUF3592 domain-containing protein [Hymenobacter arizonensis]SFQ78627.1 Protein of unknown function [Hymenobacter arizonensis]